MIRDGKKFPTRVRKVGLIPADKSRTAIFTKLLDASASRTGGLSPFKGPSRSIGCDEWENSWEIPVNPDERRCVRTASFCIFQWPGRQLLLQRISVDFNEERARLPRFNGTKGTTLLLVLPARSIFTETRWDSWTRRVIRAIIRSRGCRCREGIRGTRRRPEKRVINRRTDVSFGRTLNRPVRDATEKRGGWRFAKELNRISRDNNAR